MSAHATYQGIPYELNETSPNDWEWSFQPPFGKKRLGRIKGEWGFAITLVRRAIEVWHLMNPGHQSRAA